MPIRVLVADDNSLMRRQIRTLLELDEDVDLCAEAVNGIDAVRRAQEAHPDVAIVDFQMPLMNGLEATRRIKALMPFVHVLIFALDYSSQLECEGELARADAILPKAEGGWRLSRVVHSLMHRN